MVDLTGIYWDLVLAQGRAQGLDDERLRKLRSAQLLRSLGAKNDFTKAAAEVAQNIGSLRAFLLENQGRYSQPGRLRERERDEIEEEVGAYVKACSGNIAKLQAALRTAPTASPARAAPASPDLLAHRQGSVLILSERLGALTAAFDRLRALRYKQLQAEEANRRRRTPQGGGAAPRAGAAAAAARAIGGGLRAAFDAASGGATAAPDGSPLGAPPQRQVQGQLDAENVALQAELLALGDQVQTTERSVREIATLNQMFSTAILQQSEQIEQLYSDAVAATGAIGAANVQLGKAVRANRSAQKCMFLLLLTASLALLFLDWWYS